ncbi:MAG: pilus assembly protein [Sphingomonas sp.]|nr:pilus assembly protein [Sphingomonas sp.]
MKRATLLRLGGDARGVTIVEFAAVLPVLCILLMGLFDMGYRSYAQSVVQGALHEAARMATVGGFTNEEIDARVRQRLSAFMHSAELETRTQSYFDFIGVRQPERIVQDTAPLGQYNPGDCYEDANGNGQYDLDRGRDGTGNAEDVVRYEVTLSYPRMFPVGKLLGWTDDVTIVSNTMLRNQPFAARPTGVVVRC